MALSPLEFKYPKKSTRIKIPTWHYLTYGKIAMLLFALSILALGLLVLLRIGFIQLEPQVLAIQDTQVRNNEAGSTRTNPIYELVPADTYWVETIGSYWEQPKLGEDELRVTNIGEDALDVMVLDPFAQTSELEFQLPLEAVNIKIYKNSLLNYVVRSAGGDQLWLVSDQTQEIYRSDSGWQIDDYLVDSSSNEILLILRDLETGAIKLVSLTARGVEVDLMSPSAIELAKFTNSGNRYIFMSDTQSQCHRYEKEGGELTLLDDCLLAHPLQYSQRRLVDNFEAISDFPIVGKIQEVTAQYEYEDVAELAEFELPRYAVRAGGDLYFVKYEQYYVGDRLYAGQIGVVYLQGDSENLIYTPAPGEEVAELLLIDSYLYMLIVRADHTNYILGIDPNDGYSTFTVDVGACNFECNLEILSGYNL